MTAGSESWACTIFSLGDAACYDIVASAGFELPLILPSAPCFLDFDEDLRTEVTRFAILRKRFVESCFALGFARSSSLSPLRKAFISPGKADVFSSDNLLARATLMKENHNTHTPCETKHGVTVHPGVLEIHARRTILEHDDLQLVVPPTSARANLTNPTTQQGRGERSVLNGSLSSNEKRVRSLALVDHARPRSSAHGLGPQTQKEKDLLPKTRPDREPIAPNHMYRSLPERLLPGRSYRGGKKQQS